MESEKSVVEKTPKDDEDDYWPENHTSEMLPTTVEILQKKLETVPTFGKALFLICGMVNFGFSFGFPTSLSIYFLEWQDSFKENRATTASIHATCVGTLNTAAIIPGILMSRYGDRFTLLLGCCLASLGMLLSSFAFSVPYMVVTTGVVFGMGCCMINLPTIPCITSVFTKNQSIFIASLCFGSGLMNTVLPFFYTFLYTEFGWKGSHMITAGLILQTCISSLIITSYRTTGVELQPEETPQDKGNSWCQNGNKNNINHNNKDLQVLKTGFFLDGISMSSLHSSTFGSQILSPKPKKNTLDSDCNHSNQTKRGNLLKLSISKVSVNSPDVELSEKKGVLIRVKSSHPFLFDPIYIVEVLSSSFCLSAIYSTIALMMDFTKTKGYSDDSVSVFLTFLSFLFSMFGKIFTGLMNVIPIVHSYHLLCSYGVASGVLLIALVHTNEYIPLCVEFAAIGFSLGGLASVYPKCVLDMKTVDIRTYPLALSINNTFTGFFDIILPVLMGYTVDKYDSYTSALYLYSSVCLALTFAMTLIFYLKSREEFFCTRSENE